MILLEKSTSLSPNIHSPVTTSVAHETPMNTAGEVWWSIVESTLLRWKQDPSLLDEEGMENPSRDTIDRAILLASNLLTTRQRPPTNIVSNANGGIVFERHQGATYESIEIDEGKEPEHCFIHSGKMVFRKTFTMTE